MLECVPNVSEGRDRRIVDRLGAACGSSLLDVHADVDHHRSVFTLAGPGEHDAERAVRALAESVAATLDVRRHVGVHPRLGALDVVPFVALGATPPGEAVAAAHAFARWACDELGASVYLYGDADPDRRTLPALRAAAPRTPPDLSPATPAPQLGSVAVGARPPLVAINCLIPAAPEVARAIAAAVRERDGGLPGVRALGLELASRGCAQVSMNLVDLPRTGIEAACTRVRDLARDAGTSVDEVELVGLVPAEELARCGPEFLAWSGLGPSATIEWRLEARAGGGEAALRR